MRCAIIIFKRKDCATFLKKDFFGFPYKKTAQLLYINYKKYHIRIPFYISTIIMNEMQ